MLAEQEINSSKPSRWDLSGYLQACSPRFLLTSLISLGNGVLYALTIPETGGKNLEKFLSIEGPAADTAIHVLSAGAGLCYTMFYYKTIESLNLKYTNPSQVIFSLFAPFAATCYLTGGVEGAELLKFLSSDAALGIGITLFIFRNVSCFDASMKFPDRLGEMKQSWVKAWNEKNYAELARLVVTVLASVGYSISATDSIYAAVQTILGWFSVNANAASITGYVSSGIGALGILPLTLYWTHRGLKQLTGGGEKDSEGNNPDLTDLYTYLGLLFVSPNILGVIGASTSTHGSVFGRLGTPAEIIRLITSVIYAASSGTPGLSSFIRSIASSCCPSDLEESTALKSQGNRNSMTFFSLNTGGGNPADLPLIVDSEAENVIII